MDGYVTRYQTASLVLWLMLSTSGCLVEESTPQADSSSIPVGSVLQGSPPQEAIIEAIPSSSISPVAILHESDTPPNDGLQPIPKDTDESDSPEIPEIPPIIPPPDIPQTRLTPIARWDTIPYQRIERGQTLNAGVVAFSKYGIDKIAFSINGGGYKGQNPLYATEMAFNDQSNVAEYHVPISASDFSEDGPITIEATVFGKDGGVRDRDTDPNDEGLTALPLVVNPNGTLPRPEAFVRPGADDGSGTVGNRAKPFGSIRGAINAIREWRSKNGYGDNADGGLVRLEPGSHVADAHVSSTPVTNEWITITNADGGNFENTEIAGQGNISGVEKLAIHGVTLRSSDGPVVYVGDKSLLWTDSSELIGNGRYTIGEHPLNISGGAAFLTNTTIQNVRMGTSYGKVMLARGVSVKHTSDDAFQGVPLLVNCSAEDIDPGTFEPYGGIQHADAWQGANYGMNNYIAYNYRAKDLHYQGFFNAALELASNNALVNVCMVMADETTHSVGGLYGEYEHLLIWNCSFLPSPQGVGGGFGVLPANNKFRITNSSFRGNVFGQLWEGGNINGWSNAADIDFSDNHYIDSVSPFSISPGDPARTTVGEAELILDDISNPKFGCPAPTSPLLNRIMNPPVTVDATGKPRPVPATVGAFEP